MNNINFISDLHEKSFEISFDFQKKILTVSVYLFGIIVGLSGLVDHKETTHNIYLLISYSLALLLLLLGIVFVAIGLYGFVVSRRKLRDKYIQKICDKLGSGENTRLIVVKAHEKGEKDPYNTSSWIGMISLLLSAICFTIYLILRAFLL